MGVVYLGRRTTASGEQRAAVKVIEPRILIDHRTIGRFRREIAALYALHDPGVAGIIASDLDDQPAWYATDHIDGPTLANHVRHRGPLAADLLPSLALGLLGTLARVHAHGFTHRDLKPPNILLGPVGPVLIDFGIATLAEGPSYTMTDFRPRSQGWSAPEQITGEHPTGPPTDVFAAGLVLAWAGTGRHPFDPTGEATSPQLDFAVVHRTPSLAALTGPLQHLIARMLAPDPARRPPASDLVAELVATIPPEQALDLAGAAARTGWMGPADTWWRAAADSGLASAVARQAQLLADEGSGDAALAALRAHAATARTGEDHALVAAALLDTGWALDGQGCLEPAVACFEWLIADYADDPSPAIRERVAMALVSMGWDLERLGRSQAAIACHDRLIGLFADDSTPAMRVRVAWALHNKGVALGRLDRVPEAIGCHERLVADYANDPSPAIREPVAMALLTMGSDLERLGSGREALACYDRLIREFANDSAPGVRQAVAQARRASQR